MMKHVADCFPLITLQNFEYQPLPTESTLEVRVLAPGSFKFYILTVSCINSSNSIKGSVHALSIWSTVFFTTFCKMWYFISYF